MSDCKIYLAPMQGVTEAPFRNFFERDFGGVNAFYTPFIRWEHGGVRRKDIRDITPGNNMVPVLIPQVLAGSADEGESILGQILPFGYKEVDFNMGCAYPMVAKKGKGSGILDKPDAVRDLLSLAEKYPEIHFSVKMRLGYQNVDDCMSLLPILNAVPLSRVVVHARSGMQQYNGDCDRVAFERFAIECKHPVVYNGEMLNRCGGEYYWLPRGWPQNFVMAEYGMMTRNARLSENSMMLYLSIMLHRWKGAKSRY